MITLARRGEIHTGAFIANQDAVPLVPNFLHQDGTLAVYGGNYTPVFPQEVPYAIDGKIPT